MADTPQSPPLPEDEPTTAMPADRSDGESSFSESEAAETIGEFRLLRRLGKGGMAEVWLAEQTSLKRHVALKLLRRDMTRDDTYVKRFETEAKASAGLNHPNIVQVYTVGQEDGQHYIAQEYVQGQTLRNLLKKKGPLSATAALHIIRQVAAGLQAAADRGIVHRDIKPENIMITRKGEVKVADFGLAQQMQGDQLHLTQEGITMGTPLYMSPEQVKGRKLDHRSDVYSFGVTCYHMLTGHPPFEGATAVAVAVQHLNDDPEPLASLRPDLPRPLCEMVERMMAKEPKDRYPDARSVLQDARRLLKALKEAPEGADDVADLAASGPTARTAGARTDRRTIVWRSVTCVLIGGIAAGLGWWLRTPNLLATVEPSGFSFPRELTARDQYVRAMIEGRGEEGFLAVQIWFSGSDDDNEYYRMLSTEQLALIYLQDPSRKDDALSELDTLRSYRPTWCSWEAQLGEAAIAATDNDMTAAANKLPKLPIPDSVSARWRELYGDTQEQVREYNAARTRSAMSAAPPSEEASAAPAPGEATDQSATPRVNGF